MKRLLSLTAVMLLLSALIPVAVSARTDVQAAYADGILSVKWDAPEEVLKEIGDNSGQRHIPQFSDSGYAEFALSLNPGTHHFTAFFESSTYANFSVTVEAVEPGFRVDSLSWDNAAKTLSVFWQADTAVNLQMLMIGDTEYPIFASDSPLIITLDTLSPGEYAVEYVFEALGETHKYFDSEHRFFCVGETVSTSISISEENGETVFTVTNVFGRPVAGVTVRITLGSTDWLPQITDDNGQVRLSASLSEVTRVQTDDLEINGIIYTGAVYEQSAATTTPHTEPSSQDVIASTASTRRSTTKPRASKTTATTTTVAGLSTHVGPKTTGIEQDLIALNAVTDENVLKAFGLTGEKPDIGARLLVDRSLYKALADSGKTVPMLSMLTDTNTFSAAQAKELIRRELSEFDPQSVRTLTLDLGILFWDEKAESGTPISALPNGEYIIRLPRPAEMADCNHFYVVSPKGETVNEPIEAIVEPEYIQFTLSELGSVALFACESDRSSIGLYIHPVAYVFLTLGCILLLLAAVMIYFFFIRRDPETDAISADGIFTAEDPKKPSSENILLEQFLRGTSDDDKP